MTFLRPSMFFTQLEDGVLLNTILWRLAPIVRSMPPELRNFLADQVLRLPSVPFDVPVQYYRQVKPFLRQLHSLRLEDLPALRRAVADLLIVPVTLATDARQLQDSRQPQESPASLHLRGFVGKRPEQLRSAYWRAFPRSADTPSGLSRVTAGTLQSTSDALVAASSKSSDVGVAPVPLGVLQPVGALVASRLPDPLSRLDGLASLGLRLPPEAIQVGPRKFDYSNDFRTRFGWIGKVEDLMVSYCRPYLLRLDLVRLSSDDVVTSSVSPVPLLDASSSPMNLARIAASHASLSPPAVLPSNEKLLTSDLLPGLSLASDFFEPVPTRSLDASPPETSTLASAP